MQHAQLREGCVPSLKGRPVVHGDGERVEHRLARCAFGIESQLQRRAQAGHLDDDSEAGPVVARVVEFRHMLGAERALVEPPWGVDSGPTATAVGPATPWSYPAMSSRRPSGYRHSTLW